jgi:uncharacterized protein YjbJ (UPF0337 family)
MGERIDEMKGNIKQGVGKATGNEKLEAEGRVEHDTARASREVKGAANQAKGHVEEGIGKMTSDEELRARGIADRLKGDVDRAG